MTVTLNLSESETYLPSEVRICMCTHLNLLVTDTNDIAALLFTGSCTFGCRGVFYFQPLRRKGISRPAAECPSCFHSSIRVPETKPHLLTCGLLTTPSHELPPNRHHCVARQCDVAPDSATIHLRVHVAHENESLAQKMSYDLVAEFGQCKFDGIPTMDCQPGLICQVRDQYYGQCFKERAVLWEQCGGKD